METTFQVGSPSMSSVWLNGDYIGVRLAVTNKNMFKPSPVQGFRAKTRHV